MSTPSPTSPGRFVVPAFIFLATAFAGWKLEGDGSAPAADKTVAAEITTKASSRATRTQRVYGPSARAKQQMRAVLEAGSTQDRMRATISLVNSLSLDDLARWMDERWFENRNGFELTLFNKLSKERWQKEDPEGYLAWTIRENTQSSQEVFSRWAEEDPQRLLDFFKETPDTQKELQALGQIAKNDPALALARFREIISNGGLDPNNAYMGQQFLRELAATSPATLEAAMDDLPDNLRAQAEGALIAERLKTDFDGELRKLLDRPDGWKLFEAGLNNGYSADLGDKILAQLDDLPASWKASLSRNYYRFISDTNAATWLALDFEGHGFTDQQANQVKSYAIQRLSSRDPAAALGALDGLELEDANRQNILQNIFARHAGDEAKTAELMAMLGSEADRETALKASESRGDDPFSGGNSAEKIETPEQWIEKASAFDPKTGSSYQMTYLLREWTREQIAELGTQFQSMPEDNKRAVATVLTTDNDAIDPGLKADAIRYIIENPEPQEGQDEQQASRNAASLTSQHAVKWGIKDPVAASEWTSTLPAGDARLWAQKNLARNWAGYDPAAAKQWVNSLPATDREAVDQFMKGDPPR